MLLLFHAVQPSAVVGYGVLRVRLLDGGSVSPVSVSSTENTENTEKAAAQNTEISTSQKQLVADASQNSLQGVNGYLPVSALSERPELLKDIDPEWYLQGLDLPSLSALLLINEYGDVDDLVINTPTLTPMLLEDLRIRFRAARFLPGRLHGQPVKVALRVVIELE